MNKIKLAEALLRRKELNEKVARIERIKVQDLYEVKARRVRVTESLDDITAEVPKLDLNQVTREYDFYARQLRELDAAIQQANWTSEVEIAESVVADYIAPKFD